jgi:predicted enzyme related to lactoylglutathione lyase
MNKQQAIDQVASNISSIFTKQDVLDLLNKIEDGGYTISHILEKVESAFDYMSWSDVVDTDSATFGVVDGDRIILEHIEVYVKDVMRVIRSQVN